MGEANKADAVLMIAQERQRQITEEGYDAAHDDDHYGHSGGEIAQAAAAYALGGGRVQNIDGSRVIDIWPTAWGAEEDTIKRKPRIRQLVIAGALIVAEIERLQRAEASCGPDDVRSQCCDASVTWAADGPICDKCGKWAVTKLTAREAKVSV